jgi:hypothetical protein
VGIVLFELLTRVALRVVSAITWPSTSRRDITPVWSVNAVKARTSKPKDDLKGRTGRTAKTGVVASTETLLSSIRRLRIVEAVSTTYSVA